ncbi:hypothetical protein SISNIDRAFT_6945 [Sistotremastrum niveocremeum HHB9708]|nr:hypothetical protein SISNIDRAFT_6945 [Sistotremastrum niveocremeum HHB9708]
MQSPNRRLLPPLITSLPPSPPPSHRLTRQRSHLQEPNPLPPNNFTSIRHENSTLAVPTLHLQTDHLMPPHPNTLRAPHLNIIPATPSPVTPHPGSAFTMASPMSISSPSGSWSAQSPLSPNSKKPRVTMGPRADCPKCKMGTPGHWMHYNYD